MAAKPKGSKRRNTYVIVGVLAVAAAYLYYRWRKGREEQATGQATGQLVAIEPEGAGGRGSSTAGEQGIQGLPGEIGPAGPTGDVTEQATTAAGAAGSAAGAAAGSAGAAQGAAAAAANSAAVAGIVAQGVIAAGRAYQQGVQAAPHPSSIGRPPTVVVGRIVTAAEAAGGVVPRETASATPPPHSAVQGSAPISPGETTSWVRIGAPIYAPAGTPAPPQPAPPPPPSVADYWTEQKALHPGSW